MAKEISDENDAKNLQNDLDKVVDWTRQWGMKFNTLKCVVMTVGNKWKKLQNNYHFDTMVPVHSGAPSGLRILLAKVIISAAVLELEPP